MRRSSVRNACEPASEGGMRSDMAYRPATGFLSHSMVHFGAQLPVELRYGGDFSQRDVTNFSQPGFLVRSNLVFIRIHYKHLEHMKSETNPFYSGNDAAHIAFPMCDGLHPPLASAESSRSDQVLTVCVRVHRRGRVLVDRSDRRL